jgi:hypothetical protein
MTVSSANNRNQNTGNGSNTAFTYTFKIFDEDDIQVYLDDELQVITTDYTVSGVGNPAGGTVTFVSAPANGVIVTLILDEPFTQEIDYVDGDDFPASAHEEGLDRSVLRDLTLSERISRSLLLPPETTITDLVLPTPVADNVLGWNGTGDELENKVAATSYLPSPTPAGSMLRVNAGATGYELRTPTEVRGDISGAKSGSNSDITALNVLATINSDQLAGTKNKIINGSFDIWQQGTTVTYSTSGTYTADQWQNEFDGAGSTRAVSRTSYVGGPLETAMPTKYYATVACSVAGSGATFNNFIQRIEGVNTLHNGQVTISYWVYNAGSAYTQAILIRQYFGTGGSPSASVDVSTTVDLNAASWTLVKKTITLADAITSKAYGTNNDDHLLIGLSLPLNQTYTFAFSNVQLERGAVASKFEVEPFYETLRKCQRYYEKSFPYATAPAQNTGSALGAVTATGQVLNQRFGAYTPFKVSKRVAPTITTYSTNAASANWGTNGTTPTVVVSNVGENSCYIAGTTAITAGNDYPVHFTANARY